jgi:dTDP-4-amino-4,6-dideoxygalactose transaminase
VPVEVDPATAAMDLAAAAAAVTERTAAIVPVHLYGRPAPLPDLGLPIVEDAAQAHGALDPNGPAGVAAAYSFYPTKNVGGIGDGGAIVTDDADLAQRARRLRVHGMEEQYVHTEVAQNFRLSEVEAAWLRLALHDLAGRNERRREIAAAYRHAAPGLGWQADHRGHVHHLCVFRSPDRDAARAALAEHGVATAVHYPLALTQQPAYHRFGRAPYPEAEAWAAECVTVPCFPELTTGEVTTVARALADLADVRAARRTTERAR